MIIESDAVLTSKSGATFVVGNPNLQDESIDGFLLGYMGEVGRMSLRAEAYLSHTRHNIAPFSELYSSSNFTGPAGRHSIDPRAEAATSIRSTSTTSTSFGSPALSPGSSSSRGRICTSSPTTLTNRSRFNTTRALAETIATSAC